ncbi:MAG: glycosyltransferase [Gammaproteobacteria bacterium]
MKILHVIGSMSVHDGGPTQAVRDMARAVADLGHEVWIYSTDAARHGEPAHPLGVDVECGKARIRYFANAHPRPWLRSPALNQALTETIPGCDLVVIHSLYHYHSWRAAALSRRFSVPYVIRPHGTLDPFIWRRRRWLKIFFEYWFQNRDLRAAAALHYTTEQERELARPYVRGSDGFVVPLGVWPRDMPKAAEGAGDGARGDSLLYLGRLHPKKGIDLLVRAFARLAPDQPELRLTIAGSGSPAYTGELRRLVHELGLRGRVDFHGYVQGVEKDELLSRAAFFVLPSHSENFGIAVVEAMAAGLPVLISDDVNLCAAVREAGAGWVCAAALDELTTTLRQALAEREQWQAIGARGRNLVERCYSWEVIAPRLASEYRKIVT